MNKDAEILIKEAKENISRLAMMQDILSELINNTHNAGEIDEEYLREFNQKLVLLGADSIKPKNNLMVN